MRPVAIGLVVVALLIAGVTAFLANKFLSSQKPATPAGQQMAVVSEKVLVAARDINPGTILREDDLRWQDWPQTQINPAYIVRGQGESPVSAYVGSITRRAFLAGEPMNSKAVFKSKEGGTLANMLTPGMRAVAVTVAPSTSVAGFVLPGDRVDILLSMDVRSQTQALNGNGAPPPSGDYLRFTVDTLLEDVRVLAINTSLAKGEGSTIAGQTATLEVTLRQAEMLANAERMGTLSLALRSTARPDGIPDELPAYVTDLETSKTLAATLGGPRRSGDGGDGDSMTVNLPASRTVKINMGGSTSSKNF